MTARSTLRTALALKMRVDRVTAITTARSTIRATLGKKMRTRSVSGTATGGSTLAVADTGRDEENDYWNKAWVTVTDTSGSAIETREVNDFTSGVSGGTGQMDVLRAFSFTVATGDTYELHQKLSVDELNDSINHAIRKARGVVYAETDPVELTADTSTTSLPLDYIYAAARAECYEVLASDAADDNEFRRYMTKSADFSERAKDLLREYVKFSDTDLDDSINSAIRRAKGKIFTKNSATVSSTASTYDYTLGTDTGEVYRVELQASTATATYPYYKMFRWRMRDGASTPILEFDQEVPGGYTIRYYHITQPSELAADTATTDLPLDYIYDAARAELYEVLAADARDKDEFRMARQKAGDFDQKAERLLRRYAKQFPAGRVFKEPQWLGGEGWYEVTYAKEDLK